MTPAATPHQPTVDGRQAPLAARQPGQIALQEVIRPVAIAVMLTCIAIAVGALLQRVAPDWPGRLFIVLAFVTSLESIHAYRILAHRDVGTRDRLRFRFVEWVTLLLIIRFGVYLHYGRERLLEDAAAWTVNAFTFFDFGFVLNGLLVFIFWYIALALARAVWELEVTPIEHMPAVTDPRYYLRVTMPHHGQTDRRARMFLIISVYLLGGTFLLIFTGLAQVDLQSFQPLPNVRLGALGANALAYFAVGLLLISQARYTVLRAQWELQGIAIKGQIGQRWIALAILFLLLTALGAVLLPSGYSVPIFEAVSLAARWLTWVIVQVLMLIVFFAAVALRFLLDLVLGRTSPQPAMPTPQPTPIPPVETSGRGPSLAWQILRSLLFWWALLGVAGYSLLHFLEDRLQLLAWLKRSKVFAWLRQLWSTLWAAVHRTISTAKGTLSELRSRARHRQAARSTARTQRRILLGRLTPRERARYYYLTTLHRADRAGLGRPPHLTPNEYQTVLAQGLPDAAHESEGLTGIFDEARYSAHEIDDSTASRARQLRRQLLRWLQRRRGTAGSDTPRERDARSPD